jgi:hypothetical protein
MADAWSRGGGSRLLDDLLYGAAADRDRSIPFPGSSGDHPKGEGDSSEVRRLPD